MTETVSTIQWSLEVSLNGVELTDMPPVSRERVNEDIREFQRIYAKVHPGVQASRIRYLALDELDF